MISTDFAKLALPLSSVRTVATPQNNLGSTTGWVSLKEALDTYAIMTPKVRTNKLTADATGITSTTLADLFTGLPIYAGKKYFFTAYIKYDGTAASGNRGIKFAPSGATAADVTWDYVGNTNTAAKVGSYVGALTSTTISNSTNDITDNVVKLQGYIDCSTSATFNIQVASEASGCTLTPNSGSILYLEEIY